MAISPKIPFPVKTFLSQLAFNVGSELRQELIEKNPFTLFCRRAGKDPAFRLFS